MASIIIQHVNLAGIATTVPKAKKTVDDLSPVFGKDESLKISSYVGVKNRRTSDGHFVVSDLFYRSADALLTALGWERYSVDLVVVVSQTHDYYLPATACLLQERLGLSKNTAAFDVSLGCSGYIYGLATVGAMLQSGLIKRGLLMVGDLISQRVSPNDRSTAPLFGDAASVTALEYRPDASPLYFVLGTDGKGAKNLIIPAGGFRQPSNPQTAIPVADEDGNIRSANDLYMNGPEIFSFTIREVPSMLRQVLDLSQTSLEQLDAIVLHQANQFMLDYLIKRMKLPRNKTTIAMEDFGNTSSASVPLAMTSSLRGSLSSGLQRLLLAGFGVGYSWGAAVVNTDCLVMPELIEVTVDGQA